MTSSDSRAKELLLGVGPRIRGRLSAAGQAAEAMKSLSIHGGVSGGLGCERRQAEYCGAR